MAYGRILDYESHWRLANDVYQTVLDYTSQEQDAEMVIDAHMQMGYGSRMLGEWEDAAQSYAAAGQIASAHGDIPRVLRSRIADAKLAIDRGNLPHAELLLDDTIEQSRTDEGLSEIRSLALHERAAVAYMRGQFESSVKIAYDALRGMRNATARDRVLADIASCFAELGVLSAARDALVIVAATAQEAYLRWVAEINLLELSARLRSETAFEMYRRALHGAELPASLEANYHLHVGRGYQHFGKFDQAKAALKRAVEVAAKHKFNQLVFEAEKSLGEIERGVAGEEVVAGEAVGEVKEIAEAITEMRVAAGLPD
jgi:tetratricopeptide (TPR) repeat protein